jgi:hypothetical protein
MVFVQRSIRDAKSLDLCYNFNPVRHLLFLYILILLLPACISHPSKQFESRISTVPDSTKTGDYYDPRLNAYYDSTKAEGDYRSEYRIIKDRINTKIAASNGNYFIMTIDSQRIMYFSWGNDTIQRMDTVSYMLYVAERIGIVYSTKDYLILHYSTGSDTHLSLIFPMNRGEPAQICENMFCFDIENNLLVTEYWGGYILPNKVPDQNNFPDTIIAVTNLKTRQNQFIIEKQRLCGSPMWHYCIDSISVANKVLSYDWITPHKIPSKREDAPKKTKTKKRIRITI